MWLGLPETGLTYTVLGSLESYFQRPTAISLPVCHLYQRSLIYHLFSYLSSIIYIIYQSSTYINYIIHPSSTYNSQIGKYLLAGESSKRCVGLKCPAVDPALGEELIHLTTFMDPAETQTFICL